MPLVFAIRIDFVLECTVSFSSKISQQESKYSTSRARESVNQAINQSIHQAINQSSNRQIPILLYNYICYCFFYRAFTTVNPLPYFLACRYETTKCDTKDRPEFPSHCPTVGAFVRKSLQYGIKVEYPQECGKLW